MYVNKNVYEFFAWYFYLQNKKYLYPTKYSYAKYEKTSLGCFVNAKLIGCDVDEDVESV